MGLGEHARWTGRHGAAVRDTAEPAVPVASGEAVPGAAKGGGQKTEGAGASRSADEVQRMSHGGFSFYGALRGPQDNGFSVVGKLVLLSQGFGSGSIEGRETQALMGLALPS